MILQRVFPPDNGGNPAPALLATKKGKLAKVYYPETHFFLELNAVLKENGK